MKGVSHTDPVGEEFALRVMNHMKEAADRLADSNDEEGVARFIEKYILKTE